MSTQELINLFSVTLSIRMADVSKVLFHHLLNDRKVPV